MKTASRKEKRLGATGMNNRGAVMVIFAILLITLIGFGALAIDAGMCYVVKAELSKSVDAAAIAGAANISNPFVDAMDLAEEFGEENFPAGLMGTPAKGNTGAVAFTGTEEEGHEIRVEGEVNAQTYLAKIFGFEKVTVANAGVAKKNEVEIMLVLDRSGSMDTGKPKPIEQLKAAATSFVGFFEETEDEDKLGLVSFATSVTVNRALGTNFVSAMTTAISKMTAVGATNAEDALYQAGNASKGGLVDQSGLSGDERVQQYVIFFSDGNPTAFRGTFKYNGTEYDGVVCGTGNDCATVYEKFGYPEKESYYSGIDPRFTGDGLPVASSACKDYPVSGYPLATTKWYAFADYPIAGYTVSSQCFIPRITYTRSGRYPRYTYTYTVNGKLAEYVRDTTRQMAVDHAQELKDRYVKIYTIGLGAVDEDFLALIASGKSFEYYTPDSAELEAIFNAIAKDIKLRLVQ